jgi:GT2 family glycosyltransferase
MSYTIVHLEVTQPLPALEIPVNQTGIGLILRFHDRPVGFVMRELLSSYQIPSAELEQWIAEEIGTKLLQEKIREELLPPVDSTGFAQLTVAICTKDRPDNLNRLLQSLLPLQQGEPDPCFEILVVDNAPSDDRTNDLVASFPSVRYTREPKAGLDFARNCALKDATGELLAFLDDDVVVDRQWLNGLMNAWAENPDAAAFTGLVLPYELETDAQILFEQRGGFRRGFEKIRHGLQQADNPLYPCGAGIFGAGCNMAFRRQILLQLGGFDDALDTGKSLPGGGDLDIFYRVIRSGYPLVYEPQYLVYHQHRRELNQLRHQYWTWGLGLMAYVVKSIQHDPAMRFRMVQLIVWWVKDQLWQLKQSLSGQHALSPGMILSEFWGGIVGLCGEYGRSQRRIEQIRRQCS